MRLSGVDHLHHEPAVGVGPVTGQVVGGDAEPQAPEGVAGRGRLHPVAQPTAADALDEVVDARRRDGHPVRLQRPVALPAHGARAAAVVEQRVHGLLQHALLVAHNDVGGAQLDQALQPVIAVDDATIEVV